jgi:hypothetical protein
MKGQRPPSRTRDAEIRRFTQTAAARKRRLPPLSPSEPAAPAGNAPDPASPPPIEITGETASPRSSIRPGLRKYQSPTLQQPPQPWFNQSDTPLPLRLSEEQGPSTVTGGEGPPIIPPNDEGTPGSPPDPDPSRGAAPLSAAGSLTVAATAALSGVAAQSGVGGFNAQSATLQPSTLPANRPTIYPTPPDDTVTAIEPLNRKRAARVPGRPRTKQTARARTKQSAIINRAEVIRQTKALIIVLEEALDYDPVRGHNQQPPALWSNDPSYLKDVKALVAELQRLNSLLEAKRPRQKEAKRAVIDLTQHLDTFLKNYAAWFGRGAAALTVSSIAGLLHYAGLDPTAVWSIIKAPH